MACSSVALFLGQMRQHCDGLLNVRPGLPVRGAANGFFTGATKVTQGLVPHFAAQRMMGQPLDLLRQPIVVELLDRLHDARMQCFAALQQHAAVGHFVGQRVLEGVLEVGEETLLVHEFPGLQRTETLVQQLLGKLDDRLQQRVGHILADHRRSLQQMLVVRSKPVDACGEDRLHRIRNLDAGRWRSQPVGSAASVQGTGLHQCAGAFFEEQRIPLCAIDQ